MAIRALTLVLLVAGCHTQAQNQAPLCTPNNNVFCRCVDLSAGTKKCSGDGQSFSDCVCEDDPGPNPQSTTQPSTQTLTTSTSTPNDPTSATCPGKPVTVDAATPPTIHGDTTTATSSYVPPTGVCAVATGKARVYQILPTSTGVLTATLKPASGFQPMLYMSNTGCNVSMLEVCADPVASGATTTAQMNVVAGGQYYLFASGENASVGSFEIDFTLVPGGFCGDGVIEQGEACDDGNNVPLDGCSDTCQPEGDPIPLGECSGTSGGMPVHLWPAATVIIDGSTAPYPNMHSSAMCSFGQDAQDRVYHLFSHTEANVTVQLTAQFNGGIYIYTGGCTGGSEAICQDDTPGASLPSVTSLTTGVEDGDELWLFVDGDQAAKGSFELSIQASQ